VGILTAPANLFAAASANPGSSTNRDKLEGTPAGVGCSQISARGWRSRLSILEDLTMRTAIQRPPITKARNLLHDCFDLA
jgi:hypothetical protein